MRYSGSLAALSVPRVINVQGLAQYARPSDARWDLFAAGLAISYLPPGLLNFGGPAPKASDTLSILQVGVEARWYPWRFVFVGLNFGWQMWQDNATNFGHSFKYQTFSGYITPRAGVLYRFRFGLELGADVGATFRYLPRTSASPYDGDHDASSLTNQLGYPVIPEVTLGRVGYVFF